MDIDVVADNLDTEYFISVYYRFDESEAFVKLGDVTTEPVTSLTFPTSTADYKIQLRFDFYTNESYNTPQLLGYSLRYVPRPDTTQVFQIQLVLADRLLLHNGAIESRSVSQQWSDLKAARDADEAITFVDMLGDSYTAHVTNLARQISTRREVNKSKVEDVFIVTVGLTQA